MPWVQSAVSHSIVEHLPGLLAMVSLSLDHSDVGSKQSLPRKHPVDDA